MGRLTGLRVDRRVRVAFATVAITLAVGTVVGLWLLWPRGSVATSSEGRNDVIGPRPTYRGEVVAASDVQCGSSLVGAPSSLAARVCLHATIQLEEGPDTGRSVPLEFPEVPSTPRLRTGDEIFLGHVQEATDGPQYYYVDRDRGSLLLLLAAVFVLFVLVLGRWRGLMAILGLACSIAILLRFVLPAILAGRDPLLVAIVACSAIAFLALYLAQGFSTVTTVALLGTLGGLVVAIVAAQLAVEAARFTGFASEGAFLVSLGAQNVNLSGLVLAGMIIGALGAIDDMTVTQSSTVAELRVASPGMTRRETFRSAMRVGKDHVASTVNTLVLAYAGASLPLLLLFVVTQQSWTSVVSGEAVAAELVRTLAGSLGLVAAVPITTALAAVAFGTEQEDWIYDGVDLAADDDGPLFPGTEPQR